MVEKLGVHHSQLCLKLIQPFTGAQTRSTHISETPPDLRLVTWVTFVQGEPHSLLFVFFLEPQEYSGRMEDGAIRKITV